MKPWEIPVVGGAVIATPRLGVLATRPADYVTFIGWPAWMAARHRYLPLGIVGRRVSINAAAGL